MEISHSELLKNITRQNLTEYLELSGWENAESPKDAWLVYAGPNDYYGEPLEIVLSKQEDTRSAQEYVVSAIDLLSTLNREPPDITIQRIQGVNRDILNVRNTGSTNRVSIPLSLAVRQTGKLQALVKAATYSERDALPFYSSKYQYNLAEKMAYEFQFGHTQNRSFGLTIQSPILLKPIEYKQTSLPLPGIQIEPIETLAPIPRRIVERIIRGLVATKNAVKQQSVDLLVHSYQSGFNSNMCKAIVDISRNKESTVEYSVLWSPKIAPPEDIASVGPVLLSGTDYTFLEKAAVEMKKLQPDDTVKVRGTIEGLTSPDDPHKFGVGQSIVVKWERFDTGRTIKIIIDLNPNEYLEALRAHENYHPIEATGEAKEMGSKWRLLNPKNFRVVPAGD